jgi:hypothetical protein
MHTGDNDIMCVQNVGAVPEKAGDELLGPDGSAYLLIRASQFVITVRGDELPWGASAT